MGMTENAYRIGMLLRYNETGSKGGISGMKPDDYLLVVGDTFLDAPARRLVPMWNLAKTRKENWLVNNLNAFCDVVFVDGD